MIRQLIYDTLRVDDEIVAIVGADGTYSTYDETPPTPFLVIRFGGVTPRLRKVAESGYIQIWAHDEPGTYSKIDDLLARCKVVLEALPNQGTLFEVAWIEDSGDLPFDPLTGVIGRYSRFQHTSRR